MTLLSIAPNDHAICRHLNHPPPPKNSGARFESDRLIDDSNALQIRRCIIGNGKQFFMLVRCNYIACWLSGAPDIEKSFPRDSHFSWNEGLQKMLKSRTAYNPWFDVRASLVFSLTFEQRQINQIRYQEIRSRRLKIVGRPICHATNHLLEWIYCDLCLGINLYACRVLATASSKLHTQWTKRQWHVDLFALNY